MDRHGEIVELDPAAADVDEAAAAWSAACAAAMPGREASTLETHRRWLAVPRHQERTRLWLARRAGAVAGAAALDLEDGPAGRDQAWGRLVVAAGHRGHGIGRRLLGSLARAAEAEDRGELGLASARAGVGFADALGLRRATEEIISDLDLARAPWDRIGEWATGAGAARRGYRLLGWEGACPDELAGGYAVAKRTMNLAPTDDLNVPEHIYDAATITAQDNHRTRVYAAFTTHVALDGAGDIVGFTELCVAGAPSRLAYIEDTAVVPAHRGRGLSRWMKAAALVELRARWPHMAAARTWNAASNAPILKVNRQFGFRPVLRVMTHQDPTTAILARLGDLSHG